MADIRINSLPTTAVASSSDDFLALDGTTNGTRKLNAYSPTFGGNLTVNGTGTSSFSGSISVSGGGNDGTYGTVLYLAPSGFTTYRHAISTSASAGGPTFNLLKFSLANGASTTTDVLTLIGNGNATLAGSLTVSGAGGVNVASNTKFWSLNQAAYYYIPQSGFNTGDLDAVNGIRLLKGGTAVLTAGNSTDGNVTVTNNLTVSGGTIGTAASTNLTLNGGSSGASLALGQGTTGTFTFTLPSINAGSTTWVSAGATGIGIDFKRATATATLGGTLASLNGYNGATRSTIFEFNGDGATDSGRFDWWVKPTAGSLTQAMVLKSNGNLLVGTTTDSSNGKIQLADHTTSAGGIGFGTDISLFRRTTNGGLALNATSGRPFLYFRNNSIDTASVGTIDGDLYVTVPTAKNIYFSTNDTIALTLDSNRNATFTGTGTFNKFLSVNFGADNCFFTGNPGGSVFFRTALDATAGTQTRNSPSALFRGAYWNGSATTNIDATVQVTASTTVANNSLDFGFTSGGGTQSLRIFQSGDASFAGTIATQGGTASTPANAFATGTAGTIRWDASYIYVCTAANTWKRVAIAAW